MGMLAEDRALMPSKTTKPSRAPKAAKETPESSASPSAFRKAFQKLITRPPQAPQNFAITSASQENVPAAGIAAAKPDTRLMPIDPDAKPAQGEPGMDALEAKIDPILPIAAGIDRNGDKRIRSGVADPTAYELYQHRGAYQGPDSDLMTSYVRPDDGTRPVKENGALDAAGFGQSLAMGASEVVNDLNARVGGLRKWGADDPMTSDDDPIYRYTTPSGETYIGAGKADGGNLEYFWKMPDDSLATGEQIDKAVLKKFDTHYTLDDGRRIPIAYLDNLTPDKFDHSEFPDGSVFGDSTGYVPEWIAQAPKEQVNENKQLAGDVDQAPEWAKPIVGLGNAASNALGLGLAEPRAPWKNNSGDSVWNGDYWSDLAEGYQEGREGGGNVLDGVKGALGTTNLDEAIPWMIDMNLNSLPYYIPGYNWASGAAAATPYAYGYDGSSYMPTGTGAVGLDQLGKGTYKDHDISRAQQVGGVMAPLMDALAERFSGKAIGGGEKFLPKNMRGGAIEDFITKNPIGQVLASGVTEGIEELASSNLQQMQQEGLKNLGRRRQYNDKTGEMEFVPGSMRGETIPDTMGADYLAGNTLGMGTAGVTNVPAMMARARYGKPVDVAPSPRRTQADLDKLRSLERTPGENEEP